MVFRKHSFFILLLISKTKGQIRRANKIVRGILN